MLRLSRRLKALVQMVPHGVKIADIGTDHAFLPCYLLREKIASAAIGVEVNKGPYHKACATVEEYDLLEKIEIRLGDGLAVIKPGEVNAIIIAGMGGTVIRDILEKSPQVVASLDKLIIQPMRAPELVREWLVEHAWSISEEELIYEDKRFYQIIGAIPQRSENRKSVGVQFSPVLMNEFILNELETLYGPILMNKRHPLLAGLVEKDMKGLQEIINELAKSDTKDAQKRLIKYQEKLQELKELKEWLSVAKQS